MTTTDTVEAHIEYLDPKKISPDPANPRKVLRDMEEFTASIALHGILDPISVRPDPDKQGHYVVDIAGHRRRQAALNLKLPLVPCIVNGSADERVRATRRMVSNLQRDDLNAAEYAQGVQALFDLGMEEADVASGLSLDVADVQAASKVARSEKAVAITTKHNLTFDQALVLAEFDDDKEILVHLSTTAVKNPGQFDHLVERYRQARTEQLLLDTATADWKEKGYGIIEEAPTYSDEKAARLTSLRAPGKERALNRQTHGSCPGRAVYVYVDREDKVDVIDVCLDWRANGHTNIHERLSSKAPSKTAAKKAGVELTAAQAKQADAATAERRIHLAGMNASKAATVVRRQFVADVCKRTTAPTGMARFGIEAFLEFRITGQEAMYAELTGMTKGTAASPSSDVEIRFAKKLTDKALPIALFAAIAAHVEMEWEANTWAHKVDRWSNMMKARHAYLAFLVTLGYEASTVEKVLLGKAKGPDVLREADAMKAAKKAAPKKAPDAPPKKAPPKATKKAPAKRTAKKINARRLPARKRSTGVRR